MNKQTEYEAMLSMIPEATGDREKSGLNRTLREMEQARKKLVTKHPERMRNILHQKRKCERCGRLFLIDKLVVSEYQTRRADKKGKGIQTNYRYLCAADYKMIKRKNRMGNE